MAGHDQAVDLRLAHVQYGLDAGCGVAVAAVDREVLRDIPFLQGDAGGGRGGLEPDADEDEGLLGLPPRHGDGVLDGIDDPHVAAVRTGVEQGANGGRDPHHVPERGDGDAVPGQRDGVGDLLAGGHAHRAARPLVDLHPSLIHHGLEAEADDGVLVGPADVHEPALHA
ncbi:hypothetical protein AUQ37_00520 [Candidatus Methanomethylophilus sp. 1R26]|nr:hypothetical protein AUQ37_00520 [Candidatus Methanomethylophilus sp. 1R26]